VRLLDSDGRSGSYYTEATLRRYLVPYSLFSVVLCKILYYTARPSLQYRCTEGVLHKPYYTFYVLIRVSFLLFCLLYKVKGAAADCHYFHMSDSSTTSTLDEDTDLLQFLQGLGGQGRNRSFRWRTAVLAACLVQRSYRQRSFRRRAR